MKILHVITTLDVGGAEMHVLSQARGQVARGHTVRIGYLKGKGSVAGECRDAGAAWVGAFGLGPAGIAALRAQMRWADVVHSHLLKADALTAAVAFVCGRTRALVSSKHNDEQVLRRPVISRLHGVLGNLPARTIVLSEHVRRFIEQYGRVRPDRLRRIYYGIEPAPFAAAARMDAAERARQRGLLGIGPREVVFVCVARFAPQKAHDVLLKAFRALLDQERPEDAPARLVLVGDDPFGDGRVRAEALARELDFRERVLFTGIRRDVATLMGISDAFVMCSLWEGFGLVFLEAMSAGLPVIGTGVSAVPEVVDDGVTGVLVPPGDSAALAAAMRSIASDPALRARMGERGRERVRDRFGLDRMIEETLSVYREVVTAKE